MLVKNVFVCVNSAESGMAFASSKHLSNVKGVFANLKKDGCSARYDKNKNFMFLFELNLKQKKWAEVS